MKYEFEPMEWRPYGGDDCWITSQAGWRIFKTSTKCFKFCLNHLNTVGIFPTIDEAKVAAEKHRQSLVEKFGGVSI
jgi:hypothetical protein